MPIQYETIMTFESKSSKTGKCYTVKRRVDTGAISCDCKQWIFNRNGDRTCYHTERVKVLSVSETGIMYKVAPEKIAPATISKGLAKTLRDKGYNVDESYVNEGPVTEKPRQLRLEKKEK